jgi:hypothetical protein
LVERAIIEKKEDEKIEKMEVKKNQGL